MDYIESWYKKGNLIGLSAYERELVVKLFGDVYLGNATEDPGTLTLTKASNYYSDPSGRTPLFILSPLECSIEGVWVDDSTKYKTVRLGTSDLKIIALYLEAKNKTGLYITLSPEGRNLSDRHSFGI